MLKLEALKKDLAVSERADAETDLTRKRASFYNFHEKHAHMSDWAALDHTLRDMMKRYTYIDNALEEVLWPAYRSIKGYDFVGPDRMDEIDVRFHELFQAESIEPLLRHIYEGRGGFDLAWKEMRAAIGFKKP